MRHPAQLFFFCVLLAAVALTREGEAALTRPEAFRRAQELVALGRKMFFDPTLSGSGKMSCASCHDPAFAFGPPNALPVQRGGRHMSQWGIRTVPSLRYLQVVPQFTEHYFDANDSGDDSIDNGPTGGLTWDGRVDRGRDQARIPLLSSYEMANTDEQSVVTAAQKASYSLELKKLSGGSTDTRTIFGTIIEALEAWEEDYQEFYPYSSKYDAWLAGKANLSATESRGLKLFTDPEKGNCARCHIPTRGVNGTPPQFSDYGFVALGVPRNNQIPANSNPHWYDLGLCGPERLDLRTNDKYCGCFMTPSLRNVATRRSFFHNGVFHTLKEAVAFYAQRDTNPEKWYPRNHDGTVAKFDDLPAQYHSDIEMEAPFGRQPGDAPALSDREIEDVVAFLRTLTDGFRPGH
jgi:cytochrome c peroxidase